MANAVEISGATQAQLAHLEHELAEVKHALALLGAKPCSVCGRYSLSANPRNLFHAGAELVCYPCLSNWWLDRCPQLGIPERRRASRSSGYLEPAAGGRTLISNIAGHCLPVTNSRSCCAS